MKKNLTLFMVIIGMAFFMTSCNQKSAETSEAEEASIASGQSIAYAVNVNQSMLNWLGKKVTGQHNGTVNFSEGNLQVEEGKIVSGKFVFDMKSIKVLDLTDAKMNKTLTDHLISPDFFAVDSFPTSSFEITKAEMLDTPVDGNNYNISGNMTIRGISKNISFPANITVDESKVVAKGKVILDRTQWNVRYGSGKFVKGLGYKMIYDEFEVSLELTAEKQ